MDQLPEVKPKIDTPLKEHEYKAKLFTKIKENVAEKGVLRYEEYKNFLELGFPFAHEKFCYYLNTSSEQLFENIKQGLITANTFLFFCKHKLYTTRYELVNKIHLQMMNEKID